MLKLECLDARNGDCFILHYGTDDNIWRAIIDGGPGRVYDEVLKPRLLELRQSQPDPQAPLRIDLGIVSHIDADHITGLLKMTKEMARQQEGNGRQDFEFGAFWHNSFGDLTGGGETQAMMAASDAVTAAREGMGDPLYNFQNASTENVLASVGQGVKLRYNIIRLGLEGNQPFQGLVLAPGMKEPFNGPKLHLIGPLEGRVDALRDKWQAEASPAELAAYTDSSVANLSSIVVLVEADGKKLLMTGDGLGSDILEGLISAGLKSNEPLHLNVLKVPHHGSENNVTQEFFEALPADIYVFSADGTHHNPDDHTLEMLVQARRADSYEMLFTTKMKTDALHSHLMDTLERLQAGHYFTFRFPEDGAHRTEINL